MKPIGLEPLVTEADVGVFRRPNCAVQFSTHAKFSVVKKKMCLTLKRSIKLSNGYRVSDLQDEKVLETGRTTM